MNTETDGRRRSKGTPHRIALCRAAGRASAEKRRQRIEERKNDPWFEHCWLFSKCSGNSDGCWNFTEYKDKLGYGKVKFRGKPLLAHRVAFWITFGHIPEGLLVCHHCDNPSCINPQHLFLGTHYENTMDAMRKGRKFIPTRPTK